MKIEKKNENIKVKKIAENRAAITRIVICLREFDAGDWSSHASVTTGVSQLLR